MQEDDEERGRVDRAVVGHVRDLARLGHLADPQLVQDAPGLLLGRLVHLAALVGGQEGERVARELGGEGQGLVGGDERVAAEGRRVPGDAGRQQAPLAVGQRERVQIADRLVQRLIEERVGALDARAGHAKGAVELPDRGAPLVERQPRRRQLAHLADARVDPQLDGGALVGAEVQLEAGAAALEAKGPRLEVQLSLVAAPVEAAVAPDDAVGLDLRLLVGAAPGAEGAADLEDVGEVGGELERHPVVERAGQVVGEHVAIDQAALDELLAAQVQEVDRVAAEDAAEVARGDRHVHLRDVVGRGLRGEDDRRAAGDAELEE